jgi:hypothetical protein
MDKFYFVIFFIWLIIVAVDIRRFNKGKIRKSQLIADVVLTVIYSILIWL